MQCNIPPVLLKITQEQIWTYNVTSTFLNSNKPRGQLNIIQQIMEVGFLAEKKIETFILRLIHFSSWFNLILICPISKAVWYYIIESAKPVLSFLLSLSGESVCVQKSNSRNRLWALVHSSASIISTGHQLIRPNHSCLACLEGGWLSVWTFLAVAVKEGDWIAVIYISVWPGESLRSRFQNFL